MKQLQYILIVTWFIGSLYLYYSFYQQGADARKVLKNQQPANAIIIAKSEQDKHQYFVDYQLIINDKIYKNQLNITQVMYQQAKINDPIKGIIYQQNMPENNGLKMIYEQQANSLLAFLMASFLSFVIAFILLMIYRILTKSSMKMPPKK